MKNNKENNVALLKAGVSKFRGVYVEVLTHCLETIKWRMLFCA
jgi:hypothetical protein